MSALIAHRDPVVPIELACRALGVSRATWYRQAKPRAIKPVTVRSPSPRRLTEAERQAVLTVLHEPRFADQPPTEIYAKLLDEGRYLCSLRTMYRLLRERGESDERRLQRPKTHHPVPRLTADGPNVVWTWDITKLATWSKALFLSLYVVLDLYSRYVVAWMVARRENSALAQQLLSDAIARHGIAPGQLCVHQDRGAPMTAHGFIGLLAALGVDPSHSRPRVSNDNAFSEAQFKTLKYQPDFPGRFSDLEHARAWCGEFFDWYNNHHQHSTLALFTPADLFFERVDELITTRQPALDAAYAASPQRFVNGPPKVPRPPKIVSINPLDIQPYRLTASELLITSVTEDLERPHEAIVL